MTKIFLFCSFSDFLHTSPLSSFQKPQIHSVCNENHQRMKRAQKQEHIPDSFTLSHYLFNFECKNCLAYFIIYDLYREQISVMVTMHLTLWAPQFLTIPCHILEATMILMAQNQNPQIQKCYPAGLSSKIWLLPHLTFSVNKLCITCFFKAMEQNPPTLEATETFENNGKTEEEIFKELNNNNKLLVVRKWKFCHNWQEINKVWCTVLIQL